MTHRERFRHFIVKHDTGREVPAITDGERLVRLDFINPKLVHFECPPRIRREGDKDKT